MSIILYNTEVTSTIKHTYQEQTPVIHAKNKTVSKTQSLQLNFQATWKRRLPILYLYMGRWVVQRLREGHPPRESQPAAGWAHPWDVPVPFLGPRKNRGDKVPTGHPGSVQMTLRGFRQSPWEASGRARSRCYTPKIHVAQQKTFLSFPE